MQKRFINKKIVQSIVLSKDMGLLGVLLVFSISFAPAFASTGLERVSIIDPKLVNAFDVPLGNSINVDQQVQISADVINNQEKSQKIAYLVQVKNEKDFVVSIGWVVGVELNPHQKFDQSLSWIPKEAGNFTAEIFVWEGFPINHKALTEHTTLQINVS